MKSFFAAYGAMLWHAVLVHLGYTLVAVGVGLILGILIGVALSRMPKKWSAVLLPILSVFQTIPGIVFIGVLFLQLGMMPATVLIALSVYATFPILKNTYTGLMNVEPRYIEAARGCGMSSFQSLCKVELPLALPSILGGVRMSAIYTVSWTVLASMIGLGGLGDFIYQGISSNNNTLIIAGAIPAALMAVLLGVLLDKLQKKAVPRGLRKEARS